MLFFSHVAYLEGFIKESRLVHAHFRVRLLDLFAFKLLITLASGFRFVSATVTSSVLHRKQTGLVIQNVYIYSLSTQIAGACMSES